MIENSVESPYRPACLQRLGLLPPFSLEDVKRAFRQRAKTAHPDGGGSAEEFAALHADYERALCLASFHESRRKWLGDRVEQYAERIKLLALLESVSARAVLQHAKRYSSDYGPDYAELLCELVSVHLNGPSATDEVLHALRCSPVFGEIQLLDLSESAVTDDGLWSLADCALAGLNLRRTAMTSQCFDLISRLPKLEWLHLGQTRIGLWGRWRLQKRCPNLEIVTSPVAEPPGFDSLAYGQMKLMQRLSDDDER